MFSRTKRKQSVATDSSLSTDSGETKQKGMSWRNHLKQLMVSKKKPPLSARRKKPKMGIDHFSTIPPEIIKEIFQFLPYPEKKNLLLVNKTWLCIAQEVFPKSKDVVFVCDTTGSMRSYLSIIKQRLTEFMERELQYGSRFGFVSYKDHDLTVPIDPVVSSIGFTKSPKNIISFFDEIIPGGGADEAEAVVDGLREALKMQWRSHSFEKAIILFCDAPSHGTPGVNGDRHPTGCPCGTKESEMMKAMKSKYIQFYMVSLADGLEKMIGNFRDSYPSLQVKKLDSHITDYFKPSKKKKQRSPKPFSAN